MTTSRMSRAPEWAALLLGIAWLLGSIAMYCRTGDNGFLFMAAVGGNVALSSVDLLTFRWRRR